MPVIGSMDLTAVSALAARPHGVVTLDEAQRSV
jgi:hypothetical protein